VAWTLPMLASGNASQVAFTAQLTCEADAQVINDTYGVSDSAEGVISDWGAPVSFTVNAPTITTSFEVSSQSVVIGQTVYFTGTAATDGAPLTYFWDFDDNTFAEGAYTSHTYHRLGLYEIYLTVSDDCGYYAEYSLFVEVTEEEEEKKLEVYLPLVQR
jgi:PKD repeat protein